MGIKFFFTSVFAIILISPLVSAQSDLGAIPGWSKTLSGSVVEAHVYNGFVYAVSADGGVYEFNASSGVLLWSKSLGESAAAVEVYRGFIYVVTSNATLYVMSSDGTVQGKLRLGAHPAFPEGFIVSDTGFFVGGTDGRLFAYSLDGRFMWEYGAGGSVMALSPSKDGGVIVAGDRQIYYLTSSGSLVRNFNLESYLRSVRLTPNLIVAYTGADRLVALNMSGDQIFNLNLADEVGYIYALNDSLLAGTRGGKIMHVLLNGTVLSSINLNSSVVAITSNDQYAMASTLNDRLYLYGRNNTLLWTTPTTGRILTFDNEDGHIIAGSSGGTLYRFNLPQKGTEELKIAAAVIAVLFVVASILLIKSWR
ncbi:Outer membrane protein assembly factor BamB [uncultured archaeon]|nr:Outer membrane protein assembly factor BamB [uncultured archaeon]